MIKRNVNLVGLCALQPQPFKKHSQHKKGIFMAAAIISLMGVTSTANAWFAHCAGRINADPGNIFVDEEVGSGWGGIFAEAEDHQRECNNRVTDWAGLMNPQDVANKACKKQPNQSVIRANSSVGNTHWRSSHYFGILTNTPARSEITYKCPDNSINVATSIATGTFQYGGVASMTTLPGETYQSDKHCMNATPSNIGVYKDLPPNGSRIQGSENNWGYTWGANEYRKVYAIKVVTVTPEQCHF
jgi:hypothetical protein